MPCQVILQVQLDYEKHIPNQYVGLMHQYLQNMFREGRLQWGQVLFVNPELQAFTEICASCERIRYTPIPRSYSSFLKKISQKFKNVILITKVEDEKDGF